MTTITRERCIRALMEISAFPTAPFFESRVAAYIVGELNRLGIPFERDRFGNIIARYEGDGAPDVPSLALMAHMDHPGFEVIAEEGKPLRALMLGGTRKECFDGRQVRVRVFPEFPPADGPDEGIPGVITGYEEIEYADGLIFDLELSDASDLSDLSEDRRYFGMWDLPPIVIKGELAHMRAIDDVVGCMTILLTLESLVERKSPCRCLGVFTRAEEIGLIGASLLAESRLLPMDTIVVSLETSKTLPGAEIGGGPVIRVGDKSRTFDGDAESVLQAARDALRKEDPETKVQRQLMSGGNCEAIVFVLSGYRTTAMAIPLGNYHNVSPEVTIEPEYIHLDDFAGQVELLTRAAELTATDTTEPLRKRYRDYTDTYRQRMLDSVARWPGHEAARNMIRRKGVNGVVEG